VYPVPLQFTAGERWGYSNAGYYALAEIITTVCGMPWTDFLQQKIFAPAGLDPQSRRGRGARGRGGFKASFFAARCGTRRFFRVPSPGSRIPNYTPRL